MRTLLASFLLAVVSINMISCQQYSAGLQKGSNRAEETSAIGSLRTIAQAQTTFSISNAGNYGTFEQLTEGGFLDSRFHHSSPALHGYVFNMQVNPATEGSQGSYSCNADPAPTSNLGGRHFYIDSISQEIRVNATQPATDKDEPLKP